LLAYLNETGDNLSCLWALYCYQRFKSW